MENRNVDSYDSAREKEWRGYQEILPTIKHWGTISRLIDGDMQAMYGDFMIVYLSGLVHVAELKVDATHYPNLFLETWSNEGLNPGWMRKLMDGSQKADLLLYYFLQPRGQLYRIWTKDLVAWAQKHLEKYPRRLQQKYKQMNKSYGRCVPIQVLEREAKLQIVQLMEERK
jgi:hypothetical protein